MIADTTEELRRRGKEDQMELMAWGFEEKFGDVLLEVDERKCRIEEVEALRPLITKEADSMSAMRFRMMTADKAFWMDIRVYRNNEIAEGRKHKRYREVVQPCIFHSCEGWSWQKRWWILCTTGRAEIMILCVRGNGSKEV